MHPFFTEISKYPELAKYCKLDIQNLPEAYIGKNKIKAILLGADPTNNGTKKSPGRKILKTVFGVNEFEEFFKPQELNLRSIGLDKDNLFIQNVCRNYFIDETSKNRKWNEIAKLWLEYLINELDIFDPERRIPVLATSEVILKLLSEKVLKASDIYKHCIKFDFNETLLGRDIYAFYRHPKYLLHKNVEYKDFLIKSII